MSPGTKALLAALALAAAGAAPAAAADATLTWETANVYAGSCGTTNRDCTWLGYATNSPPPAGANGTAAPVAPATGATVTPSSPRGGATYAWSYPGEGTYDAATGDADLEFTGGVTFIAPAPPLGHGFDLSIEAPRVVLDGDSGHLFASGKGAGGTYDAALFDLDLSAASVTSDPCTGTTTVTSIVPSIATVDTAFPANYAVGAGPDRTPNTFGSFALTIEGEPSPCVTVTPAADLDPDGATLTVTGTGFKPAMPGLYVAFGPVTAGHTDAGAYQTAKWVRPGGPDAIEPDGSFAVTLENVKATSGSVDCHRVTCGVLTMAAHGVPDRSQDTVTPVAFAAAPVSEPTPEPTPEPTVPPTPLPAAPPAAVPAAAPATVPILKRPTRPRISKVALRRKKLRFRLSQPATVHVRLQRRKGRHWRTVRRVEVVRKAGRRAVKIKLRRAGRYRVVLRAVNADGLRSKRVVDTLRIKRRSRR